MSVTIVDTPPLRAERRHAHLRRRLIDYAQSVLRFDPQENRTHRALRRCLWNPVALPFWALFLWCEFTILFPAAEDLPAAFIALALLLIVNALHESIHLLIARALHYHGTMSVLPPKVLLQEETRAADTILICIAPFVLISALLLILVVDDGTLGHIARILLIAHGGSCVSDFVSVIGAAIMATIGQPVERREFAEA